MHRHAIGMDAMIFQAADAAGQQLIDDFLIEPSCGDGDGGIGGDLGGKEGRRLRAHAF